MTSSRPHPSPHRLPTLTSSHSHTHARAHTHTHVECLVFNVFVVTRTHRKHSSALGNVVLCVSHRPALSMYACVRMCARACACVSLTLSLSLAVCTGQSSLRPVSSDTSSALTFEHKYFQKKSFPARCRIQFDGNSVLLLSDVHSFRKITLCDQMHPIASSVFKLCRFCGMQPFSLFCDSNKFDMCEETQANHEVQKCMKGCIIWKDTGVFRSESYEG